jgi:hypothetical protein
MTTSTTAEVGRGGKELTVVKIDGSTDLPIRAEHAGYDIARAVWSGAIPRRPPLIARCKGTVDVTTTIHPDFRDTHRS